MRYATSQVAGTSRLKVLKCEARYPARPTWALSAHRRV